MSVKKFFKIANQKVNSYMGETERGNEIIAEGQHMTDENNYLMVHATQYLPKTNANDEMFIESTAMSTDYKYMRNTVHVTLNHIVQGHGAGSWDDSPIIILSPFKDVMDKNGVPAELNTVDTFFSVHPDKGLILPKGTRIIKPGADIPDGHLFQIKENETVYKRGPYTDVEEKEILSLLTEYKRDQYNRLANGERELMDWELGYLGAAGRKMYEQSKDRPAFLRGMFEEERDNILSHLVRDMATQMTADRMGYKWAEHTHDGSDVHKSVNSVAEKLNTMGGMNNKGHSNSLYGSVMESVMHNLNQTFDYGIKENMQNIQELEEYLSDQKLWFNNTVTLALIDDRDIDIISLFEKNLRENIEYWYSDTHGAYKGMNNFDPNLYETVKRYAARKNKDWAELRAQIKSMPGYDKFIQQIRKTVKEGRRADQFQLMMQKHAAERRAA